MTEQSIADASWWRTVLGEYPTGVALITALDADGGDVAMVVGTFSAVSADPPMISFMPTRGSRSYADIRAHGRVSISILGAAHENLCRLFARRDDNRFASGNWQRSAEGIARLSDAVVWFDGVIDTEIAAGDHDIVLVRVDNFGVGDGEAGLPLLFLRGGYGTFAVPSLSYDVQGLSWQLRLSDALRPAIETFAAQHEVECILTAVAGESVVVLSAANTVQRSLDAVHRRPVGAAFPFAAPLGAVFASFGTEATRKNWIENSRHVLGAVDRSALGTLVDTVRERGFSVTTGHSVSERFEALFETPQPSRSEVIRLWGEVAAMGTVGSLGEGLESNGLELDSLQLPIFGADGIAVLVLTVGALGGDRTHADLPGLIAESTAFAAALSELAQASGDLVAPSGTATEGK